MGQRRLDTLGDISRYGLLVLFRCRCGRETRYEPLDLVKMLGSSGLSLADLRGRCSGCGKRGVRAIIDPLSMAERPLGTNVVPIRVKPRTD